MGWGCVCWLRWGRRRAKAWSELTRSLSSACRVPTRPGEPETALEACGQLAHDRLLDVVLGQRFESNGRRNAENPSGGVSASATGARKKPRDAFWVVVYPRHRTRTVALRDREQVPPPRPHSVESTAWRPRHMTTGAGA